MQGYTQLGTDWTRDTRNEENRMFKELYDQVGNVVQEITEEVINQIIDDSRLNWLPSFVDTYEDIATTYPNPSEGDTTMQRYDSADYPVDENDKRAAGTIWRFDGTAWDPVMGIDPSAITGLETTINNKLGNFDDLETESKSDIVSAINSSVNSLREFVVNAKNPPAPLLPIALDGVTDDTQSLQAILDHVGNLGGGTVFIPKGTLIHTINYVPENVKLIGSGYETIIKLKDNFIVEGEIRNPSGIYCNYRVGFFAVENLTYDGNAENNIDILNADNHDNYYSHGICNFYIDPTVDPYNQNGNIHHAKDFLIKNVHIKNTVRNCLLMGGKTREKGTVTNVILENAYLDHCIYESNMNSVITYDDIEIKGCWRGACIVAESGDFNNIRLTEHANNPSPNSISLGFIELRNSGATTISSTPSFSNVVIDILFEELNAIVSNKLGEVKGAYFENLKVYQVDDVEYGVYGSPVGIFRIFGNENVKINDIEVNNVNKCSILSIRSGSKNISAENIVVNYSSNRNYISYDDNLISFSNYEAQDINGVYVKNVFISEKAPRFITTGNQGGNTINVKNVKLENIVMTSNGETDAFDIFTNLAYYNFKLFDIINSDIDNYALLGSNANAFRDDSNIQLSNVYYNGKPSDYRVRVPFPAGQTSQTVDFPYIAKPRTVDCTYFNEPSDITMPHISVSNAQVTLSYPTATTEYKEFYVTSAF